MEIFDYDNILLLPRKCRVESRSECDPSVEFGGRRFVLPAVPSNMKTVLDAPIAEFLAGSGHFYVMHRFDLDNVAFARQMRQKGLFVSISSGVKPQDFERFDYILAMDNTNVRHLRETWPESASARVERLLDYGARSADQEVPDPYYGSERDFEHALDLIENGCRGLLESLSTHFPESQTSGRQ